jgi:thiosulfate/3-mercaptopyruvate sulfurtransferase
MTVRFQNQLVRDVTQVAQASKLRDPQILDARAAARFRGEAPEPREGLRAGHIPGARNLPFGTLLNEDKTMKERAELRAAFEAAGIDLDRPVITTCGSGVTAAILALALERLGHHEWSLYDGSWAEWGAFPTVSVATGDA